MSRPETVHTDGVRATSVTGNDEDATALELTANPALSTWFEGCGNVIALFEK
jgi:hypothetical protein